MPKPFPHLIAFDFDGTMVDTDRLTLPDFIKYVESEYGMTISFDEWMTRYNGKSGQTLLDELNRDYNKNIDWHSFITKRNARLPALFAKGVDTAPGLIAVQTQLLQSGQTFCICTNSQGARNTMAISHLKLPSEALRTHLLNNCLSAVEDGRTPKPAPDVYLDAAQQYGATPAQSVAIEDTVTGVQAARAAGFITVGYTGLAQHPSQSPDKLKAAGADHILAHWNDFLPLLKTLA